ncbi:MAG: GNAT family N-acetyltransferase [Nocardioidaceae bacterium]
MTLFETERTRVRLWRDDEADRVFDTLSRWEVMQWLGEDPQVLTEPGQAEKAIATWRRRNEEDPRYGTWAIEEKATGVTAGSLILYPLPNGDGEIEIGWHLHPDAWGRGLASEPARALLVKAFDDGEAYGLDEVWALTHLTNSPSQSVCRRIGMTEMADVEGLWYAGESRIFCITRAAWLTKESTSG